MNLNKRERITLFLSGVALLGLMLFPPHLITGYFHRRPYIAHVFFLTNLTTSISYERLLIEGGIIIILTALAIIPFHKKN